MGIMSSSKNARLVAGWEAFSYFCCSAWNDAYLIDISKANANNDLGTQRSQFVPVTQVYASIDGLSSQSKLYSALEYPMAPNMAQNTGALKNDTNNLLKGNQYSLHEDQANSGQDVSLNTTTNTMQNKLSDTTVF